MQTKEQIKEEFGRWLESGCNGYFVRYKALDKWKNTSDPVWWNTAIHVANDETAEIRMKLYDGEPVYAKSIRVGYVVCFTDRKIGTVVDTSECKTSTEEIGDKSTGWVDVCDTETWQYLPDYQPKKNTKMVDLYKWVAVTKNKGGWTRKETQYLENTPKDHGYMMYVEWKMVEESKITVEVEDV